MLCSPSQTDIGGNAADTEGGMFDAKVLSGSWMVVPKCLTTLLPRHVMADSCAKLSGSKVLHNNTKQLSQGRGYTQNLLT